MKNKPYPLNSVPEICNLKEMVNYCKNEYGNCVAFQYEENNIKIEITYDQFLSDINALGTSFYRRNLKNKKIALIGENSYEWILSYFSSVNGGNVIVPIDPETSADILKECLSDAEVSAVICSRRYLEKTNKIINTIGDTKIIVLETDLQDLLIDGKNIIKSGDRSFIDFSVRNDDCNVIVYTSGTTSQPKGVMLSHRNLSNDAALSIKNVYFAGTNLLVLPLYHTFSFISILCIILSGRTVSINKNLKDLKDDLIKYKPQNLILVPMIVESLYKQIWIQAKKKKQAWILHILISISNLLMKINIDLRRKIFSSIHKSLGGNLEFIVTGGASISNKYVKGFRKMGIQVLNGYGITECSPVVAVNRNNYYRDNSAGQILDGVNIRIVDGEILVKGNIVTAGYFKNEEATADVFQDDWFKTGDLGYIDKDGFLYITGRKKNLIVLSNGKNVSPEELEDYFYSLEYIKEIIVYQINDQIEAEIYFGNEDVGLLKKQLEKDLININSKLPKYKNVTKTIIRETEFPKTSSKKIRRTRI